MNWKIHVLYLGDITIPRQMLHAESLSLFHPVTGTPLTFIAPPPPDMQDILRILRDARIRAASH